MAICKEKKNKKRKHYFFVKNKKIRMVMFNNIIPHNNYWQMAACVVFFIFIFYFIGVQKYTIAAICAIAFANYVAINLRVGVIQDKINETTVENDYVARYVDWSITTPLLVLTILLRSKISNTSIFIFLLSLDVLMIYTGYLAAITQNVNRRYFLFAVSSFFYLLLFIMLFALCGSTQPGLCIFLFFAWLVYPFLWILHRTPVNKPYLNNYNYDAAISMLDVFSKVGYGLLLPL